MSECVVRMEKPTGCSKCDVGQRTKSGIRCPIASKRHGFSCVTGVGNVGLPHYCPIIRALPEGHGDLIDRDALIDMVKTEDIALYTCFDSDDAYYSVTDLITILMMQEEIIKAKRKVDASDAVAPTDTPTDTPTVPEERSEEK